METLLPNIINDPEKLAIIEAICFTKKDLRAGWIGAGIPETGSEKFKPIAKWAKEHWYMYSSFLKHIPNDGMKMRVLDIGCGTGTSSINLSTLYPNLEITAIDIDKEAVEFAKRYNSALNIDYQAESFFDFNVGKYDYIFALEVYEHIPHSVHRIFIDKCLSALKEKGKFFFTTPNEPDARDASYGHIGFLNKKRVPKFAARYSENILDSGFINNKKLLSGRAEDFLRGGDISEFMENLGSKSHFWIVFKSTRNFSHNRSWKISAKILLKLSWIYIQFRRIYRKILSLFHIIKR